jgi:hypothetical protein
MLMMLEDIRRLFEEHHAFYEVLPYYVVVRAADGGLSMRRIHAGFDLDIYGESPNNTLVVPGADPDYTSAYAELQKMAGELSPHMTDYCSVEVLEFPSTVFFDLRHHAKAEGLLRIRISHSRGLDQPAGPPEERALQETEKQLKSLGLARR